ncbi:adhesin [Bacillus sp. UMB0899]|nr:adhesin [Bacillus sp. UMB0899]
MRNIKFLMTTIILFIFITGCSQIPTNKNTSNNSTIEVYTTIYPLQDFSKKIGGKYVDVKSILPSNVDAHSFEPTSKDIVKIAESKVFIYMGTGIEGFTDAVKEAVVEEEVELVNASENIELIRSVEEQTNENEHEEEEQGNFDPHVWLDPLKSIKLAENIKETFIEQRPENKEYFENNYLKLKEDLENLDAEFKNMIENSSNKTFLVSHSAYGYWANAYNLNQIGISGISPTQEPSQKTLKEIIDLSRERELSYILFEPNVSNKVADVVRKEIGAEILTVHNLEALTDQDIENNEDYFSLMRKNISALQKVLE